MIDGVSRRSVVLGGASASLFPRYAFSEDGVQPPLSPIPQADPTKPKPLSIAQQLDHVAVLLRTEDEKRQTFSGTGFFYSFFKSGDQALTAIVTNRHVVAGMKKLEMRWTRMSVDKGPDIGNVIDVMVDDLRNRVVFHPDKDIDLAVVAVSDLLNRFQTEARPAYALSLDQSLVASEADLKKFQPLEDVLVVGFPDGYSDQKNNVPIFRRGITATPVYLRFNGARQFMIDAAIYHGSSGSPVFLYNVGAWLNEDGVPQLGTRVGLLGVVWGVFEISTQGELRAVPAPTQFTTKVFSNIPHNLGACVPAYCILDFEPEIVKLGYKPPDDYKMRAQH